MCEIIESYMSIPRGKIDEKAEEEYSRAGVYFYSVLKNATNVFTNSFNFGVRLEGL